MSEPIAPPRLEHRLLEMRAGPEALALLLALPSIRRKAPRASNGQRAVMVFPGFMADDWSTLLLRRFLTDLGYHAEGWREGFNTGRVLNRLSKLTENVRIFAKQQGQSVALVGWSRGGIIAREIARDAPESVRQVITLGTPVRGGISGTSIGWLIQQSTGMSAEQLHQLQEDRARRPIEVPIASIFSKSDGVVAWQASIDELNPRVKHIEVKGSHIGLGFNQQVYAAIAIELARQH